LHIIKRQIDKITHEEYVELGSSIDKYLYNGEIFDVVDVENIKIKTSLNKLAYVGSFFSGQLLRLQKINDDNEVIYEILHIPNSIIDSARKQIKSNERIFVYITLFKKFNKSIPRMTYGYCITVYKSQGSEWKYVLVNLNSIKWSIIRSKYEKPDVKQKKNLFKATYTALSRASQSIWLFWM
jgi:hypothetical protein